MSPAIGNRHYYHRAHREAASLPPSEFWGQPKAYMTGGLAGYKKEWFRYDLLAGASVAAVGVPVAIAYASLAGVPAVYGLYTSLLPLLAYALLGSSRQLILAPDAATCAIVAAIVAPMAGQDPARYLSLTAAVTIIAGVYCIVAGLAHLGFLTNFLARPILTGYLNGIAISIIAGQLGTLFGFRLESAGFFRTIWRFLEHLGQTHLLTLGVSGATLALLLLLGRIAPKAPGPLVALSLGIACSAIFGLGDSGVKLLGTIPAGLPALRIPRIGIDDWQSLAVAAVGLALISYNSGMVTARGFASKNRYDIDGNREFIAMGVADIGAGLCQGFAVSGADSRTAVNDSLGGKTQVASLVAAAGVALTLMFLTRPLALLPMAALSAVLVKAALGLFDIKSLATLRHVSPVEFWLCLVTLLGVITVGVLPGVVVAVGLAMVLLIIRVSRPPDAVLGRIPGTATFGNAATHPESEHIPEFVIYRFDASLIFFNADHFKSRVRAVVAEAPAPVRCFLLDAETMLLLDTTGAATLEEVRADLKDKGVEMAIAGARSTVRTMLDRTGLAKSIGPERLFPTVDAAVGALSGNSHIAA